MISLKSRFQKRDFLFRKHSIDIFALMKSKKKHPIIKSFIFFSLGILLLLLLLNFVIMPLYVYSPEVMVPKVTGMTLNDGIKTLEDSNLTPIVGDTSYDSRYPEGTIIIQKPKAGETVKEGRRIYLVYSGGSASVIVPKLKGKSLVDARFTMERIGLKIGSVSEIPSSNPKNTVVEQQYEEGTRLKKGHTVALSISSGPSEGIIPVPDLIGRALSEAEKLLNDLELRVGKVNYQPSFSVLPNTIIDQYPSRGSKLNKGDAVDLFITRNVEISDEIRE